jgi:hypothetical protein
MPDEHENYLLQVRDSGERGYVYKQDTGFVYNNNCALMLGRILVLVYIYGVGMVLENIMCW